MLILTQHSRKKVGYSYPKKKQNESVGHEPTFYV